MSLSLPLFCKKSLSLKLLHTNGLWKQRNDKIVACLLHYIYCSGTKLSWRVTRIVLSQTDGEIALHELFWTVSEISLRDLECNSLATWNRSYAHFAISFAIVYLNFDWKTIWLRFCWRSATANRTVLLRSEIVAIAIWRFGHLNTCEDEQAKLEWMWGTNEYPWRRGTRGNREEENQLQSTETRQWWKAAWDLFGSPPLTHKQPDKCPKSLLILLVQFSGFKVLACKGLLKGSSKISLRASQNFRDGKTTICFIYEGVGHGGRRVQSENAAFCRQRHDNKILKVLNFYCQICCCHGAGS